MQWYGFNKAVAEQFPKRSLFSQGLFTDLSWSLAHLQGSASTRQWRCLLGTGLGLPVPPCGVLCGVPPLWRRVEKLKLEGPSQALFRTSPASKADPVLQGLLTIALQEWLHEKKL